MIYEKAKELNLELVSKTTDKLVEALKNKDWGPEEFTVLSQALDNILDIEKIEKYERKENKKSNIVDVAASNEIAAENLNYPEEPKSEFEYLIYQIAEKNPNSMQAITKIINENIQDTKLFHPNAYKNIIYKLKELL